MSKKELLIYGIGNPSRGDDGLGFEFVRRISEGSTFDWNHNFQLNVEDAELVAGYRSVIFVDASIKVASSFRLRPISGKGGARFTTHSQSPEGVLAMCSTLFNRSPDAYILEIRGTVFDLGEDLSPQARENLDKAWEWFQSRFSILSGHLQTSDIGI